MQNSQGINMEILHGLLNQKYVNRNMEYMDNRITVYTAQKGKCGIMGTNLTLKNMHCHHKLPSSLGGTDEFKNLIYVQGNVHRLIHAVDKEYIETLLRQINPDSKQLEKINTLRKKCKLDVIAKNEFDI